MNTNIILTPQLTSMLDILRTIDFAIKHIEENKLFVNIHLFESQELFVESLLQFNLTNDGIGVAVGKTFLNGDRIHIYLNLNAFPFKFIIFHEIGHAFLLTHYPNKQPDKSLHQQIRIIGEELFCDLYALKLLNDKNISKEIMNNHCNNYYDYLKDNLSPFKINGSLLRICNIANYFPELNNELSTMNQTNNIYCLLNEKNLNFNKLDEAIIKFFDYKI